MRIDVNTQIDCLTVTLAHNINVVNAVQREKDVLSGPIKMLLTPGVFLVNAVRRRGRRGRYARCHVESIAGRHGV